MSTYRENRQWSDRFIPRMRSLIGPHLLTPSSLEQDTKQAADLVVLKARDLTIACRIRRFGFAEKYPRQFTLRKRLDSGVMTEMRKIVYGWGDWMFYGHATEDEMDIAPWWLIDLSHFRAHLILDAHRKDRKIRHGEGDNNDGTYFQFYEIDSFPAEPSLLIAESEAAETVTVSTDAKCKHKPEFIKDGRCWICENTGAQRAS